MDSQSGIMLTTDGGPDHPEYVIGLCPNCHRNTHYGRDRADYNHLMKDIINTKKDINEHFFKTNLFWLCVLVTISTTSHSASVEDIELTD
jgi:hypothetical protein